MVLRIEDGASYIVDRLIREKRNGKVEKLGRGEAAALREEGRLAAIGEDTAGCEYWRFSADVYDAGEMIPWLRTFIGRIESLTCTNKQAERTFSEDLLQLCKMYHVASPDGETPDAGGEPDAV